MEILYFSRFQKLFALFPPKTEYNLKEPFENKNR